MSDLRLICGDCREVMRTLEACSVDAVVTDPPYGLTFMGKGWDRGVPGEEFWTEALRVAKPGAHLLAFGGTRTFHRLTCAIEDAGWEIRDCVMWVYGTGFPKSLDISKAIDKAAGAEREVVGVRRVEDIRGGNLHAKPTDERTYYDIQITAPATEAARKWAGWGTALKPAWEPVIVARKPFQGTVAANVLAFGTGGLNIDGCRVRFTSHADQESAAAAAAASQRACQNQNANRKAYGRFENGPDSIAPYLAQLDKGRFPANLIHDGSDEVTRLFPVTGGGGGGSKMNGGRRPGGFAGVGADKGDSEPCGTTFGDSGTAARFFYTAKATSNERQGSKHPTVKPLTLMRYLVRLVTPPRGIVLDPFCGSGTTIVAARCEGFSAIGIDRDPQSIADAEVRLALPWERTTPTTDSGQGSLFTEVTP